MTPEYKAAKEASVSHLGGGGIWEINSVTFVAPAAAALWALLQSRQSFFKPYTFGAAVIDFALQCCAILFAVTTYSSTPQVLVGLLFIPAIATFLQPGAMVIASSWPAEVDADGDEKPEEEKDHMPVKPFISFYRGAMMIVTCASILAVDFPVFPRRFAKTETFGTSLMDLGVGSFVFAAGIVAARQVIKQGSSKPPGLFSRLRSAGRHSLPLVVLGFIRLWTVKGLDYAEHVSEYGVHWNFFFTLALLSPAVALLQPLLRILPSYNIFAFVLAICYELYVFMTPGMKYYIFLSERIPGDWLSQNREGVFSFFGYLAIFIAGQGIGINILPREEVEDSRAPLTNLDADGLDDDEAWLEEILVQAGDAPKDPSTTPSSAKPASAPAAPPPGIPKLKPEYPKHTLGRLAVWSGIWFIFSVWSMWHYGPRMIPSRRSANLPYVCWVCCFNCTQLLAFNFIEFTMFPGLYVARTNAVEKLRIRDATSKVMAAFNRNGLAIFLLANLLTGAVNMCLSTIYMDEVRSMGIMVGYMAVLTGVALGLDWADISIKL
jgi:phosphatidylinositol glycan class W